MGDFNGDFYFSINYMKFQLKQKYYRGFTSVVRGCIIKCYQAANILSSLSLLYIHYTVSRVLFKEIEP